MIVEKVDELRDTVQQMLEAGSKIEVDELYKLLVSQIEELDITVRRRAIDLVKPTQRDDLLAARGALRQTAPLLYASTKTFVRHPEHEEARRNRDYTADEMHTALNALEAVLNGQQPQITFSDYGRIGDLINEIDTFQVSIYFSWRDRILRFAFQNRIEMEPSTYRKELHRPELEERAERIVSGSASIADAGSTRETRKQKIVAECNNLRQALQELLTEYEKSVRCFPKTFSERVGVC